MDIFSIDLQTYLADMNDLWQILQQKLLSNMPPILQLRERRTRRREPEYQTLERLSSQRMEVEGSSRQYGGYGGGYGGFIECCQGQISLYFLANRIKSNQINGEIWLISWEIKIKSKFKAQVKPP